MTKFSYQLLSVMSFMGNGENSDVIELSKDRFIVMSLANQQPERQKLLDEVDGQIVDILRNLGAKQLIDELAQTISSSLTSGNTNSSEFFNV